MKEKLLEIIENSNPRQISQLVKKDKEIFEIVKKNYGETISEKIYNTVYDKKYVCVYGRKKKFRSITSGYGFCGKANQCDCARISVSESVSASKKNLSQDEILKINEKRMRTNLKKYGVKNAGQTKKAITRHRLFYEDKELVNESVKKSKITKLKKHGDEKYNNPRQIRKTLKEKYSLEYISEKYNNSSFLILGDKERLQELYHTTSPEQIAEDFNVHVQTVYRYLNQHGLREKYKSEEENQVKNFVRSLGSDIIENSRKVLPSGKEVDIFIPEKNIAIEYNGVYWHHEQVPHIDRHYHFDKFKESEREGIRLITIFSSDWKQKQNIVKSLLKTKLGVQSECIYARNTEVKNVSTKKARAFLNNNHLQGYCPSTHRLGLYHKEKLVALMTFSRPRSGIGKKRENAYELVRFCSVGRVIGAASKLLKAFIKVHKPKEIISYSNNEISDGGLYKTLGFVLEKEHTPSYWYVHPKKEVRLHRYNYAKYKLVERGEDPDLTEAQIMQKNGYLRIWDCGKRTWRLDC